MMNVELMLVYTPPGGRPLTVARLGDRQMLIAAAQAAVVEAELRAEELATADAVLGEVERAEASRLRHVLGVLLPEFRKQEPTVAAGIM